MLGQIVIPLWNAGIYRCNSYHNSDNNDNDNDTRDFDSKFYLL